jgi:hypothetical protein
MTTEITHNFSDSEEEHEEITNAFDDDIVTITVEEHNTNVAEHLKTIKSLTQQLDSLKADHTNEVARVLESNQEQAIIFKNERAAQMQEMAKRQQRIDYLMDCMISK